jgi:hypothetical protein
MNVRKIMKKNIKNRSARAGRFCIENKERSHRPAESEDRNNRELITIAVKKVVKNYGETLRKLGRE